MRYQIRKSSLNLESIHYFNRIQAKREIPPRFSGLSPQRKLHFEASIRGLLRNWLIRKKPPRLHSKSWAGVIRKKAWDARSRLSTQNGRYSASFNRYYVAVVVAAAAVAALPTFSKYQACDTRNESKTLDQLVEASSFPNNPSLFIYVLSFDTYFQSLFISYIQFSPNNIETIRHDRTYRDAKIFVSARRGGVAFIKNAFSRAYR